MEEGHLGNRRALFKLILAKPSQQELVIDYRTADYTAISGQDYQAGSGTVTFLPGETEHTIEIATFCDHTVESTEVFFVEISCPVQIEVHKKRGVGFIITDDVGPQGGLMAILEFM